MLSFWLNELKVWYYCWFVHKSEKTRSVATVRKIGVETESMYMPSTWAQRERERESARRGRKKAIFRSEDDDNELAMQMMGNAHPSM